MAPTAFASGSTRTASGPPEASAWSPAAIHFSGGVRVGGAIGCSCRRGLGCGVDSAIRRSRPAEPGAARMPVLAL
ncbi:hypothetical protein GCM10010470_50130 [Saccharopolyspora taberi]|uniref:Uncharacterized protein n=1 Tax=Saccharopolyspora taberi TaxID=60895 RepID=A0ABN3VIM2_9PSEU